MKMSSVTTKQGLALISLKSLLVSVSNSNQSSYLELFVIYYKGLEYFFTLTLKVFRCNRVRYKIKDSLVNVSSGIPNISRSVGVWKTKAALSFHLIMKVRRKKCVR